jgi:hypothetical protein
MLGTCSPYRRAICTILRLGGRKLQNLLAVRFMRHVRRTLPGHYRLSDANDYSEPTIAFRPILCLPVGYCLPLHIERRVRSAAFEWVDVIDDVSRTAAAGSAGRRARIYTLEVILSRCAALILAVPTGSSPVGVERRERTVAVPMTGEGGEWTKQAEYCGIFWPGMI